MTPDEIATRLVGLHMIFSAAIGVFINLFMLHRFSKAQKSSFYLLCSSKTASNSMSLLIYLFYIGPVNLLYSPIGSVNLESYLNQIQGFGLLIQGPITQFLIAINRFLVICIFPVSSPNYSIPATIAALTVSWLFSVWFSTLVGLPDYCRVRFNFPHLGFFTSECSVQITLYLIEFFFLIAGITNLMNILIALKIFCSSKGQKLLSSEGARHRRKLSIRFFFQSCFQDWLIVFDYLNNWGSTKYCNKNQMCVKLVSMGFDVVLYGLDGFVMFLFNRKIGPNQDWRRKSKSTTFIKQNISKI